MKTLFVLTLSSMVIVLGFMVATIILDGKQNTRLDALEGEVQELLEIVIAASKTDSQFNVLHTQAVDLDGEMIWQLMGLSCGRDTVLYRLDSLAVENRNQTEAIKQLQKENSVLEGK